MKVGEPQEVPRLKIDRVEATWSFVREVSASDKRVDTLPAQRYRHDCTGEGSCVGLTVTRQTGASKLPYHNIPE